MKVTAHPPTMLDHNGYPDSAPYTPPFLNNETKFHNPNPIKAAGATNLIDVLNHQSGIL